MVSSRHVESGVMAACPVTWYRCRMSPAQTRYWFPAKRYGWGWGPPTTWQGWVVIALYIALVVAGVGLASPSNEPGAFIAWVVLITLLLIAVCWLKGEPPRWRWGSGGRDGR
jgi:hypothetical protein